MNDGLWLIVAVALGTVLMFVLVLVVDALFYVPEGETRVVELDNGRYGVEKRVLTGYGPEATLEWVRQKEFDDIEQAKAYADKIRSCELKQSKIKKVINFR